MSIVIVPAAPAHFARLAVQEGQAEETALLTPAIAGSACADPGMAFAVLDGALVLGIGGGQRCWPGRVTLWCYLATGIGPRFVAVHRAVARFIAGLPDRRIEAVAICGFVAAHRWLDLLGFDEPALLLRGYTPAGGDAVLRARVRI